MVIWSESTETGSQISRNPQKQGVCTSVAPVQYIISNLSMHMRGCIYPTHIYLHIHPYWLWAAVVPWQMLGQSGISVLCWVWKLHPVSALMVFE